MDDTFHHLGAVFNKTISKQETYGNIGNFPRRTLVHDLHVTFQITCTYDYINKLCRQQAEVIKNHENANYRNIEQGVPDLVNTCGLNLVAVKHVTVEVLGLQSEQLLMGHNLHY
jgi:hypothetical protein